MNRKPTFCCPKHGYPLYRRDDPCPVCREEVEDEFGEPDDDHDASICPACGGTGDALDNGTNMGECDECDGTGQLPTA